MNTKKRQLFNVTIISLHRHTTVSRQGHIHGRHRPTSAVLPPLLPDPPGSPLVALVEACHGVEQAAEADGEERADGQLRHQLAQEVGRHAVLALGALAVHNVALPGEGVWREGDQQLEHAKKPIWEFSVSKERLETRWKEA
jgi:hypothetical protein